MGRKLQGKKLLNAILAIYYLNKADIHETSWVLKNSWYYELDGWLLEYHIKRHYTITVNGASVLWACDVFPKVDGYTDYHKCKTFYLEPVENES